MVATKEEDRADSLQPLGRGGKTAGWLVGRDLVLAAAVAVAIWLGMRVLRDPTAFAGMSSIASKLAQAAVALALGVGAVWAMFIVVNSLVEYLPAGAAAIVRPYVFVLPAMALVGLYLIYPAIRTIVESIILVPEGAGPVANYQRAFTNKDVLSALRNNLIWLTLAPVTSVIIGLAFAALVDRVKWESAAKVFVFMPLAISMVGASVIWRFIYAWRPPGKSQIGLLNAIVQGLGGEPVAWLQEIPINTIALIAIMVWLQTGFAMVVLSAAIKGVPSELIEAARIDGATEFQAFLRVTVPTIRGSIITVFTTISIVVLKVFDIVFVMTGGNLDTSVVAVRMYDEMFRFRNFGQATTMAVILFVAVIPIMVVNVRNLRRQGIGS